MTLPAARTEAEFGRGHPEGFRSIPVDEIRHRIRNLDPGKPSERLVREAFAAVLLPASRPETA